MRRRFSLCSAIALIASTVVVVSVGPAAAAEHISFSGRGIAFSGTLVGVPSSFGDTLPLPPSGGFQTASALSAGIPTVYVGETLHATTFGQNDRTRTEATASAISITTGSVDIVADFAMSRAMAVSDHGVPVLSGSSEVSNLVVNDVVVPLTGAANQVVELPDGEIIVNERIESISGDIGSITVNALHVIIDQDNDFVVASSQAGVVAASSNCGTDRQPVTGGGWIHGVSLGRKATFGVSARPTTTGFHGHVVFKDNGSNTRITGPVTFYQELSPTLAVIQGPATQNGEPAGNYTVEVQDNGEPGDTDTFSIQTEGEDAYAAGGDLQGGNIQMHDPCE